MDNGALVLIVVVEAVIIVWLASKLTQYQKFEKLLSPAADKQAKQSTGRSSDDKADVAAASQFSPAVAATGAGAVSSATSAVAGAMAGSASESAELLDMPGVDPESNIEEAKRVQLVMARCRYAEFYLEQLDDDYERGQFQQIVDSCMATARNISDPFFRSSALQPLILLLDKAEWFERRDELLHEVSDDLIRQRIDTELNGVVSNNA
jgi:chorismate mutase